MAAGNGIKSATARPLPGSSRKKLCTCQLLMLRRRILSGRFFLSLLLAFPPFSLPLLPRSFRAYFSATGEFSLERFLVQSLAVERATRSLLWRGVSSRRISMHPVFAPRRRATVADIFRYFLQVLSRKYFRQRGC